MAHGYLPKGDGSLRLWAQHFGAAIAPDPAGLGLSAAQVEAFAALVAGFDVALQACAPSLRSRAAVVAKNDARAAMKAEARRLVSIIRGQAQVTLAQRTELGLRVIGGSAVSPRPPGAMQLWIESVRDQTVRLRLGGLEVSTRGLPPGVNGAVILTFVGEDPPASTAGWSFYGVVGRARFEVRFVGALPPGTRVWVTAIAHNRRKRSGPPTTPVGTHLLGMNLAPSRALAA